MYDVIMPLERLTVNLIERSSKALELAVDLTHDSKTDTINRALQLYAFLLASMSEGGHVLIEKDGELKQLVLL